MAVQIQVRSDSRQAQADLKKLEASLNSVENSAASINRSISGLATATKVAFAALPIVAVGTAALRTAAAFETLNARLVTATGSAQKASSAFIAVQKIVTKTPFSVKSLTDAYARLATTGSRVFQTQSQIERGIQNIADAVSAVGGGNVEMQRVAQAFERMASEGRLTAERLNQITDAGIPLTKIAKALGVTMEELRTESEKGVLTFDRFYGAFQKVAEAADGFGGAAARQVNTLNGAFSNLNDAFDILSDKVFRQSGLSKILINNIVGITDAINDFSRGIDVDIAAALFDLTIFSIKTKQLFREISKTIYGLGNRAIKLLPNFDIDFKNLGLELKAGFKSINLRDYVTKYSLKISDFIPSLEDVKKTIFNFGKYVKDVFYDIWDKVVGNSTWPDLIKGVTEWASKLEGMVKPHLDKFKVFVLNLFTEIKAKFNEITSKVAFEFNVSADTSALSKVSAYLAQINTNISKVIDSAKQHPTVGKFSTKLEEVTTTIIESYKQLSKTSSFQTLKGVFNGISVILADSLIPRLIAVYGAVAAFMNIDPNKLKLELTATLDKLELSNSLDKGIAEKTRGELDKFAKDLDQSIKTFKDKASKGVTGFETTEKVIGAQGDLLGKIIGDAFGTGVKNAEYTMTEILTGVVALAFSSSLRALVGTAVVVKLVFGEQSFSESLGKIYDLISKFGNNVLKGAGVPGYASETGAGGFIAGLLFGGLALATITGKLVPILTGVAKLIGAYLIVPKLFEGKEADRAANEAETFGQKTGRRLQTGMRAGFSAAGGVAGLLAAEKFSDFFKIEDKLNRAFVEIGFSIGGAMAGAMIGGFLANSLIKGGAWIAMAFSLPVIKAALTRLALSTVLLGAIFPSIAGITTAVGGMLATLATALSLPVILTALGVAAGGFLLYNIFFGEEGGWGSKIKKLFKEQIGPAIESFFTGIFSWMEVRINELSNSIKKFFTFDGKPSDGSQGSGLTVDPMLGFASGGKVSGSGTGTSDSILAKLSNGEYVVNAKATSKNRGLLERINNGLPAFNTGGAVGDATGPASVFYERKDFLKKQQQALGKLNEYFKGNSTYDFIKSNKYSNPYGILGLMSTIQKESGSSMVENVSYKTAAAVKRAKLGAFNGWSNEQIQGFLDATDDEYFTNFAYSFNKNLGNDQWGDGYKYRGRGWLQYTGKWAYDYLSKRIGADLVGNPDLLATDKSINEKALVQWARLKGIGPSSLSDVSSHFDAAELINKGVNPYKPEDANKVASISKSVAAKLKVPGFANGGYVSDKDFNMVGSYVRQFMGNVDDGYINNLLKQYKQTGQLEDHLNTLRMMTGGYANGGYVNDQDFDMVSKYIRSFVGNVDDSYINNVLKQYKQTGQLEGHLSVIRNMADGYASGGSISGPGTGTSDSILARLSNGEYVVNAQATKMNRSLLDRINAGLPAFATGGEVGALASSAGFGSNFDFSSATEKQLDQLKASLNILIQKASELNKLGDVAKEDRDAAQNSFNNLNEAVGSYLIPYAKKTAEEVTKANSKAFDAKAGEAAKDAIKNTFETGLTDFLSGKSSFKDLFTSIANEFTSQVISTFSKGVTESLFESIGPAIKSLFGGISGTGSSVGSIFSGIGSLFGGGGSSGMGGSLFDLFSGSGFGFADGGLVPTGSGAVPVIAHAGEVILNEAQQARVAAAMGPNNNAQQVSINITGDISRQTRQEIISMSPQIADMVRNNFVERRIIS